MAVRRFLLNLGQSNASPFTDGAGWRQFHFPLDLTQGTATLLTQGVTREQFTMPDSWPAPFNLPIDTKGRTIPRIRFLNFYHPSVTGYASYPHKGRVASATGGAGANTTTQFYVEQVFNASAASGASQVTITRLLTGEVRAITAVAAGIGAVGTSGCTAGSRITVAALSSVPADGEEFTYEIRANGAGAGVSTITLTQSFGMVSAFTGASPAPHALQGLKLTVNGVTFDIIGWNNATRVATLSATGTWADGAVITLSPRHGTFATWGYFLPFCPFEGSASLSTKPNPYPYGFNYPGFLHVLPLFYNPTTGAAAYPDSGSYLVGLSVRLAETFGEDIYLVSSEVGATSLANSELKAGAGGFGWHDPGQHRNWSPGVANNCFARMLVELDAAIAAAALEGDTLQCLGIFHVAGEADSNYQPWAEDWETNLRTFRDRVRTELKNRNLWPSSAATIPYVFSQPSRNQIAVGGGPALAFVETVHDGTNRLAATDRYMRAIVMDDAELITESDGSKVHYSGAGSFKLEDRAYDAWIDIQNSSDTTGVLDVCNLALSLIGDSGGVTSLDPLDGSAQAVHCARFFPIAFDEVLKMRKWTFASRRLDLTELAVDSPWPQWPFAYVLPHDFLRPIQLLPPGALDDNIVRQDNTFFDLGNTTAPFSGAPVSMPMSVEVDAQGRSVLYTVQQFAVLRYVARMPVRSCPQEFKTPVAWRLAEMLSGAIIKGPEGAAQAERCRKMLLVSLPPIDDADADRRKNDFPHVPATLRGRG